MLYLVIPARNEAPYIADTLRRLSKSLSDLTIPWQIIVADNGSTDGTCLAANEFRTTRAHRSFSEGGNHELREKITTVDCPKVGKGSAIRFAAHQSYIVPRTSYKKLDDLGHGTMYDVRCTNNDAERLGRATPALSGVERSDDNQFFGFIDADLSADPDAIPGMVARLLEDKADIVIASRLLITKTTNRGWLRTLSSKAFNFFADLFLNLRVADAQCGLKIMNERGLNILRECQEEGWFLDIEFLARARQDNLRIAEVPVPWLEFRYPNRKSQIKHFRDGVEAVKAILRINKNFRTSYIVHRTKPK